MLSGGKFAFTFCETFSLKNLSCSFLITLLGSFFYTTTSLAAAAPSFIYAPPLTAPWLLLFLSQPNSEQL